MTSLLIRKATLLGLGLAAGLPSFLLGQGAGTTAPDVPSGANWHAYLGDRAMTHYSTLTQINKDNVAKLYPAWTYVSGATGSLETNPLIIDGVLYTRIPGGFTVALDAAKGTEIWRANPAAEGAGGRGGGGGGGAYARGLIYWDAGNGDRRIVITTGNYIYELNAKDGQSVRAFGDNGRALLGGLDVDGQPNLGVSSLTPGTVYKDLIIMGSNPGEGAGGPPGHIRAFDLRTGAVRWTFHTIPHPGEFGYETFPPDYWKTGSAANNWAGMALDEPRGIVYVPTGSVGGDFWGEERFGQGLFANSLIALDANTGKRLWHFQVVHYDLWDRDLPTPPVLLTVNHNGQRVDAVAQGTKHGSVYVFNRVTGEPLWPIEERAVPQSEIPGVRSWPTQPFPTKPAPLMRTTLTVADASIISPTAKATTTLRLQTAPNRGPFPGPSEKQTVMLPGFDGGMEWGGAAADPDGVYYVNVNEVPWFYQMIKNQEADGTAVSQGKRTYQLQCANCHGITHEGDPAGGFPSLVDIGKRLTVAQVNQLLLSGGARMPSFATLSEGQRLSVVDFVFGQEKAASAYPAAQGRGGRGGGAAPAPVAPAGVVGDAAAGAGALPIDAGAGAAAATAARGGGPAPGGAAVAGRAGGGGAPAGRGAQQPYSFSGFQRWNVEGYPAISPPWGTLNAVDINTGEIKWRVPLGEYKELTAKGIPPTGTENYGGPVVTAGGLVFIAATADDMIRAFDKDTGKVLWEFKLPFSGTATPAVYSVNGKQYLVISAYGGKSGRPAGGAVVAFTLPN